MTLYRPPVSAMANWILWPLVAWWVQAHYGVPYVVPFVVAFALLDAVMVLTVGGMWPFVLVHRFKERVRSWSTRGARS